VVQTNTNNANANINVILMLLNFDHSEQPISPHSTMKDIIFLCAYRSPENQSAEEVVKKGVSQ
jgi:hypothetical protein